VIIRLSWKRLHTTAKERSQAIHHPIGDPNEVSAQGYVLGFEEWEDSFSARHENQPLSCLLQQVAGRMLEYWWE